MLQLITSRLETRITDLPWVDRYGGLVKTFEQFKPISFDDATDQYRIAASRFPVSCNVTQKECEEDNGYIDLTPNSNFKSVVFIEDRDGLAVTIPGSGSKERLYTYRSNFRVSVWLNGPLLGHDTCGFGDLAAMALMKKLSFRQNNVPISDAWPHFPIESIQWVVTGMERKERSVIYDRYTFTNEAFLAPFDFFALRLQVTFQIRPGCLPDFTLNDEITCY